MQDSVVLATPSAARRGNRALLAVYLVNASLLLCHEIDSAFWREWELFHLPGGAPGFVALHLLLVPLVLWGVVALARHSPSGRWLALAVGLAGIAGGAAHAAFLLSGDQRFTTPFSESLIAAFVVASVIQTLLALASWKHRRSER
jgi:hypothetical protein